jgi:DMSO reductase anchor subunit
MHPAFSVIFFTVVSGAGYGLLFALGVVMAGNPTLMRDGEALLLLAAGAVFTAAGLLSSMLHLGQPLRAWRAFSQWRSSWLSREGVASMVSFAPLIALGAALELHAGDSSVRALGALLAVCAFVTVVCTGKIYTSLKTIRAWHNGYVLPGYLLLGLLGGVALLQALFSLFAPVVSNYTEWARVMAPFANHLLVQCMSAVVICLLAIVTALWKHLYWDFIDRAALPASAESATGLGRFGAVRSVEAPHTEENYLTHEMGFVLARKHSRRLRTICLVLIGLVPLLLAPLLWWTPTASEPWIVSTCSLLIAASIVAGSFVERWLFFAEAKHVVMLYYGARQA